ncbi:hypothetical protein PWT90_06703 [Aphanocladium album]|nr:hypothetical protein PWT90_06703 [Aphanocladium album]
MSSSPSDQWWLYSAFIFIFSSPIVRFVAGTCFLIGLMSIFPLLAFLIYDLLLWCWRTLKYGRAAERSAQQHTETDSKATLSTSVSTKEEASGAQATRRR